MTYDLKAAMPHNNPLYSKAGRLHFIVSTTAGQPTCTNARKWVRMGRAYSGALSMYASTRGSVVGIVKPFAGKSVRPESDASWLLHVRTMSHIERKAAKLQAGR